MITDWIDLMWSMLYFVVACAYAALPLAAIVLTVDLLAGQFIAARYRFLLWMLVALRMILPVTVESSFSVQNLWASEANENTTSIAQVAAPKAANTTLPSFLDASTESQPHPIGFGAERSAAPLSVRASGWSVAIMPIVPLLWLLGAFVLIARPLLAAIRFTWSLRRCGEITDQRSPILPTPFRRNEFPAPAFICCGGILECALSVAGLEHSSFKALRSASVIRFLGS